MDVSSGREKARNVTATSEETVPEPRDEVGELGEEEEEIENGGNDARSRGSSVASYSHDMALPPRHQYPPAPRLPIYGGNAHRGQYMSSPGMWGRLNSPLPPPQVPSRSGRSSAARLVAQPSDSPPSAYPLFRHYQGSLTLLAALLALLISLTLLGWMVRLSGWGENGTLTASTSLEIPSGFDRRSLAEACHNMEDKIFQRLSDRLSTELASSRAPASCASPTKWTKTWEADAEPQIPFDYALATLGARVVSTRKTKPLTYYRAILLGLVVYEDADKEDMADAPLQPMVIPGRCWRFQEFPGELVIKLAEEVFVSSFSLSHIRSSHVPAARLRSAPHEFEVWALHDEKDLEGHLLGSFAYHVELDSSGYHHYDPEQVFRVPADNILPIPVRFILLKVTSNHGHPDYTCVYRFRVFGSPVSK